MSRATPKRIGFIFPAFANGWDGGLNYFRNLFRSIRQVDLGYEPVVLTAPEHRSDCPFDNVEVIGSDIFSFQSLLARLKRRLSYQEFLRSLLSKNQIHCVSHFDFFYGTFPVPAIGWIPDFQHKHLTNFFTTTDIEERDSRFNRIVHLSDLVILSSESARKDFCRIWPEKNDQVRILRFVPCSILDHKPSHREVLNERFHLPNEYLYVPNQFWIHKNHQLVIEAARILKSNGKNFPPIFFSGGNEEYRIKGHYEALQSLVARYKLKDSIRFLGRLSYSDVLGLMQHSKAVINPSLFEGWSSTVEEAKSLEVPLLLSDIAVHREQLQEREGSFFDPRDPHSLAGVIGEMSNRRREHDFEFLRERIRESAQRMGECYLTTVEQALKMNLKKVA